jgi:SAM-dependent methyltransferase
VSVEHWLEALEKRHLANLTTSEVTRALRALSSCYVERREKLSTGAALDGAGKRAAFALFYGPQHFVIARAIVEALGGLAVSGITRVLDLGCGTGSAGAAVALAANASIEGFDLNRWAADEASWTYRALGLNGRARVLNLSAARIEGRPGELILGAWAVNELPDEVKESLLARLLAAHARGSAVLILEPIGRRANPWWTSWSTAFAARGGRDDDWRFHDLLPPRPRALAKAAGLDVQVQTARSLLLPAQSASRTQ